jgi:hypothetical protein
MSFFTRSRDERGAIAIIVAISATALFVIAALVIDLGLARDTRRQSQNAADASALAAANVLYPLSNVCTLVNPNGAKNTPCYADAAQAAKDYAAANWGVTAAQWSSCSDPAGYWYPAGYSPCITFADAALGKTQPARPTEVRVLAPVKDIKTGFGVLAGVSTISIDSVARAGVASGTANKCALCFLGDIDAGNADFTVAGGGIQVNGDLNAGANGYWTASQIGASGDVNGSHYSPAVDETPPFTDPLAGMTLPTLTGTAFPAVHSCTTSINPGIYSTLSLGNKDKCTLNPGKYVIVGKWNLGNNSVLSGTGVTLYFTCGTVASPHVCTGADAGGGWIDGKNGDISITAGAVGSTSYAIIYDRLNPQGSIGLQGNGGTSINGGVYAPNAKLDFNGNSCFGFNGGPVVVLGVIKANGTKSCVNVTNASDITASTTPGDIALDQ